VERLLGTDLSKDNNTLFIDWQEVEDMESIGKLGVMESGRNNERIPS